MLDWNYFAGKECVYVYKSAVKSCAEAESEEEIQLTINITSGAPIAKKA